MSHLLLPPIGRGVAVSASRLYLLNVISITFMHCPAELAMADRAGQKWNKIDLHSTSLSA